jgi:hypothetical protein
MKNQEKHKTLADEQYGGRNGRSAIDVVLLKEFTLGIFHLSRCNAAIIDCDAQACYDRILPVLVTLAYFKAGLALSICTLFARTLQQMEYFMVTAFGISTECNKYSEDTPSYGLGQGATDGGAGWTSVSNIVIKSHNKKAHGSTIADPANTIKVKRSADMFVDDTTLVVNANDPALPDKTMME